VISENLRQTPRGSKNKALLNDPLLVAAATSNNPLGIVTVAGVLLARQLGAAGELASGIVKNTARIPSSTGAAYRIPDVLDDMAKIIGDVKNVSYLRLTKQLH